MQVAQFEASHRIGRTIHRAVGRHGFHHRAGHALPANQSNATPLMRVSGDGAARGEHDADDGVDAVVAQILDARLVCTEYTVLGFHPFDGRIVMRVRPQLTRASPLLGLMKTRSSRSVPPPRGVSAMTSSKRSSTVLGTSPTELVSGVMRTMSGGALSGGPPGGTA